MATTVGGRAYPLRVRLVALFVLFFLFLGGGGTPNPITELLLEIVFVGIAAAWLWWPGASADEGERADPLLVLLIAILLAVPVLQLVPLPPSVWSVLPGRQNEVASLALVDQQDTWRPLSLSASRTLASLLAIVPALGCAYAVARMTVRGRRLILVAIAVMTVLGSLLGVLQLVAGDRGINLYSQFHAGWVTGFQANKNAEADVLLIGLLAIVALVAPYVADGARRFPLAFDRRGMLALTGGVVLFLLAATAMTGSRAGAALIAVGVVFALAILLTATGLRRHRSGGLGWLVIAVPVVLLGLAAAVFAFSGDTALTRLGARFTDAPDVRLQIWQDAWFALKQYWPAGFGMGGFEPAMLPAEQLQYLDVTMPNRAHNDFLELGLEAGLLGYMMLAAATTVCLAMAWRSWRGNPAARPQVVFALGVLIVITLHSFVDYPLRSMALACLAGVAGGMLARPVGVAGASENRHAHNTVESVA
jgi:O-antigen ligase